MSLVDDIRSVCAEVAAEARHVRIVHDRIAPYAAVLPVRGEEDVEPDPVLAPAGALEERAARVLTLDAINFGSGWFPTLRKRPGRSGYGTIASALGDTFARHGPWTAAELERMDEVTIAAVLRQDPGHELMALFAAHLRALGERVRAEHDGAFLRVVEAAGGSAVALAELLGAWPTWRDVSECRGREVPFFKRAQIAAADLRRAGVARFGDLDRLTLFADNLVPHVLRVDGLLAYDEALAARIDRRQPLAHGSEEEVEIRACAVHAVELIAAAVPGVAPWQLDAFLWRRGQDRRYKSRPRHRARCTAY